MKTFLKLVCFLGLISGILLLLFKLAEQLTLPGQRQYLFSQEYKCKK